MRFKAISLILEILAGAIAASGEITVYAAASLSDSMKSLATAYLDNGGEAIRFNFASSGALARQIDAGAPADIFISAHVKWMDWLAEKNRIEKATRSELAGNSLVLIAPNDSDLAFDGQMPGRLAVGDFNSVPAGMYAEEALEHMGWLDTLMPKLVMGSNVRTVLMYVERGEVAAGIVYASDAKASDKVQIVGTFPEDSHSPIVYPVAACSNNAEARRFIEFLKGDRAKTILKGYGFTDPTGPTD